MSTYSDKYLDAYLREHFPHLFKDESRVEDEFKEAFVQFGTQTDTLIDTEHPNFFLQISLMGNLRTQDETVITIDGAETKEYGVFTLYPNESIDALKIVANWGAVRAGTLKIRYRGVTIKSNYVGSDLPALIIPRIELIDLITLISEITNIKNVESIDLIDTITTLAAITNIVNVDSVDLIDLITTISTITEVANISSVDLIDLITTISTITEVANITSVDLVDLITTISTITNVVNIDSIDLIDEITSINEIVKIGSIESGLTLRNRGFELGDLTGWVLESGSEVIDDSEHKFGAYSCKIPAGAGDRGIIQYFTTSIPAYLIKEVSCWMKGSGVQGNIGFHSLYADGSGISTTVATTTSWVQKKLSETSFAKTKAIIGIFVTVNAPSEDVFLDGFTVTLHNTIVGDQYRILPQESASPYELQVSINQDNVGLATSALQGAGLPVALDGVSLKIKEQSPLSGFATSSNQAAIILLIDGLEALLAGGLPVALDGVSLKIKEQSPLTSIIAEGASGDPIFNIEAPVAVAKVNLTATATTTLNGDAVPANKIQVITHMIAYNLTNAVTYILFYVNDGANKEVRRKKTVPAEEELLWDGHLYLGAGHFPVAQFFGCTAGDDVYFRYFGYQMDA